MSKADVIEVEGTVVEKTSKRNVSGRIREWSPDTGTYQRKAPYELYPYLTWRQGNHRDVSV